MRGNVLSHQGLRKQLNKFRTANLSLHYAIQQEMIQATKAMFLNQKFRDFASR